jgi:hypothetical protein
MTTCRATFFKILLLALCTAACGKKGDPLPPLVRVPVAPPDIKAERRGSTVDVTLTVPAVNTDGTRPANIELIQLFALTGPPDVPPETIIKYGTLVGGLDVKKPRDPNASVDADDPDAEVEPPEGPGLDQGATAAFQESVNLNSARSVGQATPRGPGNSVRGPDSFGPGGEVPTPITPLVGASPLPVRSYIAVGIGKRGRMGLLSTPARVPMVPPPGAPPQPHITYDEKTISLSWEGDAPPAAPAEADVLPSRSLVSPPTKVTYNVYAIAPPAPTGEAQKDVKLTGSPVADLRYDDRGIAFGVERCFIVRSVESIGPLSVEGDPSPKACVTPVDTFPPAAPVGLEAIGVSGGINLVWDANTETDLAGYIVLRGRGPDGPMTVITPEPIQTTNLHEAVPPNTEASYAVKAVDKAGNESAMSKIVAERAR